MEEALLIVTEAEIIHVGLKLVGYSDVEMERVALKGNRQRFAGHYGSSPFTCAQIWEALQVTTNNNARIGGSLKTLRKYLDMFLMALHWLKCYSTEIQRSAIFHVSEKTCREWSWYFTEKIAALKEEKIKFLPEWGDNNLSTFIMSVDGTHCRIFEPKHPTKSQNPEYYSHKFHHAAVNYEIGLSIFTSDLVWVKGPIPASRHDMRIFREDGLLDAIPAGKLLTGDRGYRGLPHIISTPNPHDPEELRVFKRRAQSRHELFNARLKSFACLQNSFRHSLENHDIVFFAVCVIAQFQMENGSPLPQV